MRRSLLPGRTALVLFSVVSAGTASCGVPAPDGPHLERIADTTWIIRNAPRFSDTVFTREVLRIGSMTGSEEYLFGDINTFQATYDGRVLVQDASAPLRSYDHEGAFDEELARQGEGPGEVQYVLSIAAASAGGFATYDLSNNRVTVFGDELAILPRPDGIPRYGGDALVYVGDSTLWTAVAPHLTPGGIGHPRPIYARVGVDGQLYDTVFTPGRVAEDCPAITSPRHQRGFWEDLREPFLPKVKWTMGRDGSILVGCPARYEFDVIRPDGSIVRLGRTGEALVIDRGHKSFLSEQLGLSVLPDRRPAYVRLVYFDGERAWVRPTLPSIAVPLPPEVAQQVGIPQRWEESARAVFDVFSIEEGWLGTVVLPPEARYSGFPTEPPVVIRGDTVWAIAQDSLDVQYVSKYVVQWPESP